MPSASRLRIFFIIQWCSPPFATGSTSSAKNRGAITSAHADEIAAAARTAGRALTCHYNQRTRDYVAKLRWLVKNGPLGDVYHVDAS